MKVALQEPELFYRVNFKCSVAVANDNNCMQ